MKRFKRWLEGGAMALMTWSLAGALMVVSPKAEGLHGPGLAHFFSDRGCGTSWSGNKIRSRSVTSDTHAIRVAESVGALSVAIYDIPTTFPYWCAVRKFEFGIEETIMNTLCSILLGSSPNGLYCQWEVVWSGGGP